MAVILITGATGFVGQHLVTYLQALGHELRCSVRQYSTAITASQILIPQIDADTDWTAALAQVDYVIHLAARVHIFHKDARDESEFISINSEGTKNLAEQASAAKVKRFIYMSTIKVNGEETAKNQAFREAEPEAPSDSYAKSKSLAERYLKEIGARSEMEVVILRPPLVYGPKVKANFEEMMHKVQKSRILPFGGIHNQRSFIYVENLVSAIHCVIQHPKAAGKCYLLADSKSWSLSSLLQSLAIEMNKKLILLPIPEKILRILLKMLGFQSLSNRLCSSLAVSNQLIQDELNWTPPISSEEGLRRTVLWFLQGTRKP